MLETLVESPPIQDDKGGLRCFGVNAGSMGEEASSNTLPEQLLELAQRSGAEAAEVFQSSSFAQPVFFEANRLKQLESNQSEGTAVRLWLDGRQGIAVAYGAIEPQSLVDKAIAISRLNEPSAVELTAGKAQSYPDVGTAVPISQLIDWGESTIAQIRAQYPEVICEVELECDVETVRLINSRGLDYSYSDTTLSSYLGADWIRGDDFLSVSDGQVYRDQLQPDLLAQQILQRLAWAERNVPPTVGRIPVLFTAKAADTLWGAIQDALSGKRVLEGASPWSDRLGTRVTSEAITIFQDPDAGPYSCPFDDEGMPTQRLVFIDEGILRLFYTDRTVARELGESSTGNGFRPSLESAPMPGLFNTLIKPGQHNLETLIQSLDSAIVVDQILGNVAGISGEFSVNIDLGFQIHNGSIQGRVKDTMVSGNVYKALRNLAAVGQDADWNGACYTPSVLLEGLSVTGRQ